MLACGKGIVSTSGVAGLWRGNAVHCSRYFPTQVHTPWPIVSVCSIFETRRNQTKGL